LDTHDKSEFDVSCNDVEDLKTNTYHFKLDEIEKTTKENTDIINEKKLDPSPERPFGKWYQQILGIFQLIKNVTFRISQ
jgi:hypothetical protein